MIEFEFETTISLQAQLLPADYVRFVTSRSGEIYRARDAIPDIRVIVSYEPGWEEAGDYWTPADGSDPVLDTLQIGDEGFTGDDQINPTSLPDELKRKLVRECWAHQRQSALDNFEPDDEPFDYYHPSHDYL